MPGIDASSHNGDPRRLTQTDDWYGYASSVQAASDVIRTCATPFVVAVYGRWGRGKTTFMRSIRERLLESSITHHEYSPWQYRLETFDDVWLSLITEVSAGEHPFAKSIKNAVDKANRWRTGKRIAGALLSAAADGANELFDTVADESNDYQQFIETKAQFETAAREHLQRHPQGRICIYIDDLDRCEPLTSVNVLRVVQVLCRTRGCVLVLGLDRDVIIQNLRKAYPDSDFGKEYLDKIVQLHIEVPPIPLSPIVDTLKTKGNGHPREGIEKYSTWIAEAMGYNPRKVERAVNLYDYKLSVLKHGELSRPDLDLPRIAAKFTVIELLWPALATAMAESDEIDQG